LNGRSLDEPDRDLKDLGIGDLIVALGHWLDGIDGVVNWSVVALPPPKVILPMAIMIVVAMVAVVVEPIIATVITTPIIASVWVVILLVRARNPANVFLDLLVSLISICPLLHHCEKGPGLSWASCREVWS
jgi:hypothetical protein